MLIIFLIFPIIGIVAALALMASSGWRADGAPPTPAPVTLANTSVVGQPAPNFTLASLDGGAVRLSSYRGRVVFVNFWATWCEPCQRELPAFEAFIDEQGEDGAIVLAVNAGETAEQVTSYYETHQISGIPTLLDANLAVYDQYHVQLLPTTYVIDEAGIVRGAHLGEMTPDDLESYLRELNDS
jgi:peroxiredoxin